MFASLFLLFFFFFRTSIPICLATKYSLRKNKVVKLIVTFLSFIVLLVEIYEKFGTNMVVHPLCV